MKLDMGMRADLRKWYEDLRVGDHAAHIYHSKAEQGRVIIDVLNWMDDEVKAGAHKRPVG